MSQTRSYELTRQVKLKDSQKKSNQKYILKKADYNVRERSSNLAVPTRVIIIIMHEWAT